MIMQQSNSVRLTIPADANFIDVVRLNLYGIATKMGFSYEEIEDMKVAVSEACNNAVLHAYRPEDLGSIKVRFDMLNDKLTISVKDFGNTFKYNGDLHKDKSLHNKELSEVTSGGLGIFMMQVLMDEVQVINE